ncbi:MAG: rRNA adenine N-6-methyltransferase family protein [Pseudomonadota bacterium]
MGQLITDPFRAARLVLRLRQNGITNNGVLSAMEAVDRGRYAPAGLADLAWEDMILPLPCGQSLLPPHSVARLVDSLALPAEPRGRTLLIGAGSGYTAAIVARLCKEVVAVERFKVLANHARDHLAANDVHNVEILQEDGLAARDDGPFDSILGVGLLEIDNPGVLKSLSPGGRAVFARTSGPDGHQRIGIFEGGAWRMGGSLSVSLTPLIEGVAQVL